MRDYGVIFTKYWTNPDICSLTDEGKLLGCYLLTGPHSNSLGAYRLPLKYVEEDLSWDVEKVLNELRGLSENGFAYYCEVTKWVILPKYLKWNPVQNPNQGKAVSKLFNECPENFRFYDLLVQCLLPFRERFNKGFGNRLETLSKPFRNPSETLSKPFRNQDQDQEQSFSNEKPGQDPGSNKSKHFSSKVNDPYRERLLRVLKRYANGKSEKLNAYAFVQKTIGKGGAHPEALIRILEQLLEQWKKVKNPWAWLEARFKVENQNFHELEFQGEVEEFKQTWDSFVGSDEAKEIVSHLNWARAP